MKKYLVTGGLGFIGKHLTNKLSQKNSVIVVDDKSNGNLKNLKKNKNIKIILAKIQKLKKINNIDGIFHFCAQSSAQKSIEDLNNSSINNIASTLKAFQIAKDNSCPIIFASSSAVYGNLKLGNDEKNKTDLLSPYALDKYYMEKLSSLYFKLFNVSSIGMRLYNVYGTGQKQDSKYSGIIPILLTNLKRKRKTLIYGGSQTRDFINVEDVVEISIMLLNYATKKKINEIYNVGTGKQISVLNLYKTIKNMTKNKNKFVIKNYKKGDPKISRGTFKKIRKKILPTNYNYIALDEGLKKLI